jgi:GAF domain-containing protein
MLTRAPSQIEKLVSELERSQPVASKALEHIAAEVGRIFGAAPDEVAIMELSRGGKSLRFLVPEKLRSVGEIPLTSTAALAARTVRERRAEIVNNFAASRHASVFEGVPLGRARNQVIHKIMSAPILAGDKVIGVTQISRKGLTPAEAGADFTASNLKELQALNTILGRLLALERS